MHSNQHYSRAAEANGALVAKPILILTVVILGLCRALATPSFDPFADATASGGTTYTVGATLYSQSNPTLPIPWYSRGSNSGSSIQPMIAAGNLTYPNMPPSTGNSVSFVGGTNQSACIDLNQAISHTNLVYTSFLLKLTDISAVPTFPTNNPIAAYLDDPAPQNGSIGRLGSRLLTKKVGSGYVLGISRSATQTDFVYEPDGAAHNVNDVLFVVICHQRTGGVSTNVSLWVNPPASSLGSNQPPAATVVATAGALAINNNSARAFGILGQFIPAPNGIIDDVRVSTNDWVYVTGGDPAIVTNPVNRAVPAGNNTTFSVSARGTSTLSYRWVKDGTTLLSNVGNISGANSATLTVNNVGAGDIGTYAAYVTNGLGASALSASATLNFQTDPAITNQPQDFFGYYSSNAVFHVGASGTAPVSYYWHKEGTGDLSDGGNISGSHSSTLTISNLTFGDTGNYSVTVSNNNGTVDSTTVALAVADPFISVQPIPVTTNAGLTAVFHSAGAGSTSLFYQWLKNGNPITGGGVYSGINSDTLTITNVSSAEQGNYSVQVNGTFTNAISSPAALTVLTPASILVQPRSRAVLAGVKTAFVVSAGGSSPFTYQWRRNGGDIPGATASAYVVTNAQVAVTGDYTVVVSNFTSVTSSVATLTVSNSLSLSESNLVIVRVGDGSQTLTVNGSAMFLDQFAPGGSYVNTITVPDEGNTAMAAIGWDNINGINSGATTGTSLTRSLDGRFMVLAGYCTNLNYGASLGNSTATNVPRGIALIDSSGQYNLAVASTNAVYDANASFWRAAITDGTNNFWGASTTVGTYYFGFDAPGAVVQTNFPNTRSVGLFNGDIYCATANNPTGLLKLNGMPRTLDTPSILVIGPSGGSSSGSYDLAVSPTGSLLYLCDQRNVNNGGGIQRYELTNSVWTLIYTINPGTGNLGPRYIAADFSGANPILYVTSNDQTFDNNRLIKIVDTGSGSTGTVLANAGANQTFRGIHFGPVPNAALRPQLSFGSVGSNLVLTWSGSFTLMSSTNVTGPYLDVAGATSPYTNNTASPVKRFFGLRK